MVRKIGPQGHARLRQNDYSKIIKDISEDGRLLILKSNKTPVLPCVNSSAGVFLQKGRVGH